MKNVIAGGNIRIERGTAFACFDPVSIDTFEFVFKTDSFGNEKAEAGIPKFIIRFSRRYADRCSSHRHALLVYQNFLDSSLRRNLVFRDLFRMNTNNAVGCRKPEAPIERFPAGRLESPGGFAASHSVFRA